MKTGLESVKAALRAFFDNAAEDLERTMENLRQGQFTHTRTQPRGVTQIINYTTVALLPVLSSLFEHIGQNLFGEDLICKCKAYCDLLPEKFFPHIPFMYLSLKFLRMQTTGPKLPLLLYYISYVALLWNKHFKH